MILIIGGTALYAKRGAYSAVATFLIASIATLVAFNYYPLVEWLLLKIHSGTAEYADATALLLTYFISFLLLQYMAIRFVEEHIELNPIINGFVGALFGAMACMLCAGMLVISWLMLPGSVYFKPSDSDEAHVTAGVDETVLTVVRFIANDRMKGSEPFDPTHNFMRVNTTKFVRKPGTTRRGAFKRRTSTGGGAVNLGRRREDIEEEEEE